MSNQIPIRGRGTAENPANRFIPLQRVKEEWDSELDPAPHTRFFHDHSRTALTSNNSPDIPFNYSLNPYRGCEHGCIYCYARPTHEFLSLSSGLDFESQIFVKLKAPELLRKELSSKHWQPQSVSMSGVTDAYQPIERRLELTRKCLEVFADFQNPVSIVTKNALVTRDIDILNRLSAINACAVFISITTLDNELARVMEPRASSPQARLKAIAQLAQAGIPVGVMNAPIIPGLNDHETPEILKQAAAAGARTAGYVVLRLPYSIKELFTNWLNRHFPAKANKILNRIRLIRDGTLYNSAFGSRMTGEGEWANFYKKFFRLHKRNAGLTQSDIQLSATSFRNPAGYQRSLFD